MIIKIKDQRVVAGEVESYVWIPETEGNDQEGNLFIVTKNDEDPIGVYGPKTLLGQMDKQMDEYFKGLK